VGIVGYFAGPRVHLVDIYGLCDPLLARLPTTDAWRIGHFERRIPDGYLATLSSGRNEIGDAGVARFYGELAIVTRGSIWTRQRLRAAVGLNSGRYQPLLAAWRERARTSNAEVAVGSLPSDTDQ
jgi:arabinofuranosyltransferase